MHKLVSIIFLFSVAGVFSQSIENVDFRAQSKSIVVTYDFFHSKTDTAINVELIFKDQQGGVITPKTISGDIKNVKPGESKRIVWDVLSDGISLSGKYKAEVSVQNKLSITKIGNQVWLTENLNVDHFRNGDIIPEAKTSEEWINAGKNKQAAWCYYDNDPANGQKYGKLYNWYAVNDYRGLAPEGWHIPSDNEWYTLGEILGSRDFIYIKMKSRNGWFQGFNGNNETGFNGLPSGYRKDDGFFSGIEKYCYLWSSSEQHGEYGVYRELRYDNSRHVDWRSISEKASGYSVRCIEN